MRAVSGEYRNSFKMFQCQECRLQLWAVRTFTCFPCHLLGAMLAGGGWWSPSAGDGVKAEPCTASHGARRQRSPLRELPFITLSFLCHVGTELIWQPELSWDGNKWSAWQIWINSVTWLFQALGLAEAEIVCMLQSMKITQVFIPLHYERVNSSARSGHQVTLQCNCTLQLLGSSLPLGISQ